MILTIQKKNSAKTTHLKAPASCRNNISNTCCISMKTSHLEMDDNRLVRNGHHVCSYINIQHQGEDVENISLLKLSQVYVH